MKECKNCGDTSTINCGDTYRENNNKDIYLVSATPRGKRLISLETGRSWVDLSLFGAAGREGFTKVNVCYKEQD